MATTDRNSMLYWWPRVKDLGIPVPRTIIVEQPREGFLRQTAYHIEDGEELPEGTDEFLAAVRAAADAIGYPCFLRSDQLSGKHEWARTCYIPGPEHLARHVGEILVQSLLAEGIGTIENRAMVVRELLPLHSTFTAFRGLPIARERRYFVREGVVECSHPYWPEAAVEQGRPDCGDWRRRLATLNEAPSGALAMLEVEAAQVGRACPGYWSVDFAATEDRTWWLIDMADGDQSWHPECTAINQ